MIIIVKLLYALRYDVKSVILIFVNYAFVENGSSITGREETFYMRYIRVKKYTKDVQRVHLKMADQSNGVVNQPSTQQQQTNPLSRKLNKILETRLESDKVIELNFYPITWQF